MILNYNILAYFYDVFCVPENNVSGTTSEIWGMRVWRSLRVDWFSRTPARCAPSQEQKDACTAHYAQELETA